MEHLITSKNLKPVLLLNTHCHLDHIFGNRFMLEKYNLRGQSHLLEEQNRKDAPQHAAFFGLAMDPAPEPALFLEHGQEVSFGKSSLKVLHVPGHAPGGLAFYSMKDGCVFTGDALFSGSIGRTDLPGGNFQALVRSIRNNLLTLPADTVVYPGHGPETTTGREMSTNPFLR
jgi:glyoxylase-like metal-dependent hydrolase (beta-lactamase superfamily II)